MIPCGDSRPADVVVHTDASGALGCVARWQNGWFQYSWPLERRTTHISPKEALPIVLACAVWGKVWSNKKIQVYCDNAAVVISLNAGSSKDQWTIHVIRCLFFIKVRFGLTVTISQIPGKDNILADALSHNDFAYFRTQVPTARQYSIPPQLESVLVTVQPDWMSVNCSAIVFSWNSAVHQEDLQISLGGKDPDIGSMPYLEYVLKGFRKLAAGKSRPRLPITPSILSKMRETWSKIPKRKNAAMLWAASCMCFFGFLHSGEIVVPSDTSYDPAVHLSYGDVRTDSIENPTCITVAVKASKTDPFRKGVVIHIGATKTQLCPVAQSWVT
ncbi:hypothetical protein EMCRGX_G015089 [Ephydatia muelleri]